MDIKLMISIFPSLLNGAVITLQLLVSSMFFGLIIGLIFAILRINKNPIAKAAIETAMVIELAKKSSSPQPVSPNERSSI